MESMSEFKRGSRHLRKLLRQQLDHLDTTTTYSTTTADPQLALHAQVLYNTVEPPNNGHIGNECFVHCSEVVPSSEVEMYGQ